MSLCVPSLGFIPMGAGVIPSFRRPGIFRGVDGPPCVRSSSSGGGVAPSRICSQALHLPGLLTFPAPASVRMPGVAAQTCGQQEEQGLVALCTPRAETPQTQSTLCSKRCFEMHGLGCWENVDPAELRGRDWRVAGTLPAYSRRS